MILLSFNFSISDMGIIFINLKARGKEIEARVKTQSAKLLWLLVMTQCHIYMNLRNICWMKEQTDKVIREGGWKKNYV